MKLIKDHTIGFLYLQEYIAKNLAESRPIFVGRLSGNESRLAGLVVNKRLPEQSLIYKMLTGAGIRLNNVTDMIDYVNIYNNAIMNSNCLGVWDGMMYKQAEEYYKYLDVAYKKQCFMAQSLEPFYYMGDDKYRMNEVFTGKRIAIISSHKSSIEEQIRSGRYMTVFDKPIFGEGCEFTVIRPPVQLGDSSDGRSWKSHFNEFKENVKVIISGGNKYDLVLVSCGGFGMPICNFIYSELKTSVIYVGGSLQLFFGVKGKRWETNEKIKRHFREGWINVMDADIPEGKEKIEGGCYW